ncbi:MAG: DUF1800 domain-containing protein [Planctomycetaceae bacterium]
MTPAEQALQRFRPETAWQPYYPNAADPWDEVKVAHLYRRAAFGPSWQQIRDGLRSSPGDLIERLVAGGNLSAQRAFEADYAPLAAGVMKSGDSGEAKALWCYRLLNSPSPLREKMTLFWHNHFATSNAKVRNIRLMMRQVDLLRCHALGNFDTLLQEVTRDPAMMVWLDSSNNQRGTPNENYARELMELFSLGVENYTENDVQEAARALTGWNVERGLPVFDYSRHDAGEKTIFGHSGPWAAGDAVRLCLGREACAPFIVKKIFRELVSDAVHPPDALLKPLANEFRARDYDIAWLVGTILRSWVFFSEAAIGQKVKSPCDLVLGSVLALEGRPGLIAVAQACDQLGQSLYYPPNVKGWDGGTVWLNSATLLHRQNLALELTRGTGSAGRVDPATVAAKYGCTGIVETVEYFLRLLHQRVEPHRRDAMVAQLENERLSATAALYSDGFSSASIARSAAHLAMTLPEYQLG